MLIWMKMKNTFISSIFNDIPKIDENVVFFVTWKVVQGPLDTMWHLFNLICDYNPNCKCIYNEM